MTAETRAVPHATLADALVTTERVRYSETDQMGVAYHSHYLVWCDIGRTEFIRRLGLSYAEIEKDGLLLAVADVGIRYGASARYDDLVSIETRLTQVRSRSLRFDYVISRGTEPRERLATAFVRLVAMSRAGVPRRLPDELLKLFRDGLSSDQT